MTGAGGTDETAAMHPYDFGPSTRTMAALVAATSDDQLAGRTPCPDYTVADLLDHIGGLTVEFTYAARKEPTPGSGGASGDGSGLEPGWRERIARDLDALAASWSVPAAYEGATHAGPIDLPAPVAAQVALNEVVVHGWDLARATGRDYDADPAAVATCVGFVASFDAPADDDGGLFGPRVDVGEDADAIDRLVGLTGRQPGWAP